MSIRSRRNAYSVHGRPLFARARFDEVKRQVCSRIFGLIVQLEAAGPDGICVVGSSIAYTHFDSAASGRVLPTMVLTCFAIID